MVDFRPLLFLNALALMLLVTAGFASVLSELPVAAAPLQSLRDEAPIKPARKPVETQSPQTVAEAPETAPTPAPAPAPAPETVAEATVEVKAAPVEQPGSTEQFNIPDLPDKAVMLASAEPPAAIATYTAKAEPEQPPAPTTGALTLRSNVAGDRVEINGKDYGATRLDLELAPGKYDITISKDGFRPWQQSVALDAGNELTLVGKLEAYTTVNYQNGNWRGGIKTGDGTYEDKDGLKYEGQFVDGAFHGSGTAWYPDGTRYEGDWDTGKRAGEGVWRDADGSRYTGQFAADSFQGQGTLTLANGDILTGEWSQGRLNGHGSLTTADGMLYVGGFRNSDFHGRGTLTYPDGRHYEGDFSNGTFHGRGSEVFANGKKYEGEYIEGKFHGNGLLRNPNGSSIEATFRHGEPYGQVRLTTAAGEIFTARTTEPGVCYRDKSYRATQCPKLEGW
ncbi:MORN repeat-containing protein [Marinobacter sediminicola]|uniref:MORN repeat-containing protein n=1 Tax=Marinobacter sediminicola TaxID=3072994 RepID=UPI0028109E45|nr:PEGA domain-containing protein [Marinobacter sp. F26243]